MTSCSKLIVHVIGFGVTMHLLFGFKNKPGSLALMVLCCLILPLKSYAVTLISKGAAPIVQGNIALAREKAIDDAIRNAALQSGSRVKSVQRYEQGMIIQDDIELTADAKVAQVQVLSEDIHQHHIEVEAKVTLDPVKGCTHSEKSFYQRTLAIAEFGVQNPKDLSFGQLRGVGATLGQRFTQVLNHEHKLSALNIQEAVLYKSLAKAPRTSTNTLPLSSHYEIAKEMGTQFIISGVIQSMGMLNPNSWFGTNNLRTFELTVYVHDGISGSLIEKFPIKGEAIWHFNRHQRVRMGSAEFWDSDYGLMIEQAFTQTAQKIARSLECLPYMAHVMDARQHRIRISAGISSGLRPGDKLSLVRKTTQYGLQLEPLTELKRTYIEATIKQVQPNYSIAELDQYDDSGRYAIQRGDLVVKW